MKASDETFAVDLGWHFANNWLLFGQYFESNDHSRWTLEEDIEWKDVVFQADSDVAAGVGFSLTRVFLGHMHGIVRRCERQASSNNGITLADISSWSAPWPGAVHCQTD